MRGLIREDRAATNGVVLAELLQGARTVGEASELRLALDTTVWLESGRDVYARAGTLGSELRRRGKTVPITDRITAAAAESVGGGVLTLDDHFEELARVASLRLEGA